MENLKQVLVPIFLQFFFLWGGWLFFICSFLKHQFSCSFISDSLWPHGLQHTRLPCPSPTPRACSNSCPSSRWCCPTISLSVVPFSSCLQSFPASGPFPMSQFFASGGQLQLQYLGLISFRMDWLDLLAIQRTLKHLLQHHSWKASILKHSVFFIVQLAHPYMTTGKTIALTRQTFVSKVISLLFKMLSRFFIAFLSRSNHLLISWAPKSLWMMTAAMKLKDACSLEEKRWPT